MHTKIAVLALFLAIAASASARSKYAKFIKPNKCI